MQMETDSANYWLSKQNIPKYAWKASSVFKNTFTLRKSEEKILKNLIVKLINNYLRPSLNSNFDLERKRCEDLHIKNPLF